MTAQVPEKLIIDGKRKSMTFCPPIPDSPDIITPVPDEEVDAAIKAGKLDSVICSTACWRGYIGTWEIKDGNFFLKKLVGCIELAQSKPIHATWFTGVIRIPQGKLLHYVHMGFGSLYEKELHIKIEAGVVTKQRVIDNAERIEKLKNMAPGEQFLEDLSNMPGLENHFFGDDW